MTSKVGSGQRLGMKDAFALGAAASVATVVMGVARGKIAAVLLGPEGLGQVGDVTQAISLLFVPITMLSGPALVRAVAIAHKADDPDSVRTAYRTVMTAVPVAGALGVVAALLAGPWLVNMPTSVALPMLAVASLAVATKGVYGLQRQILIGLGDIRRATVLSLMHAAAALPAMLGGTLLFGGLGYLGGPAVATLAAMLLAGFLLARSAPGVDWSLRPEVDRDLVRDSAKIGTAVLVNNLTMQAMLVAIRWQLAEQGGQALNGQFHAAWAIGSIQVNNLLMALGQFIFPRYAAATGRDELAREITEATSFMLRVTPAVVFLALAFRDVALRLLFSSDFLASGPLVSCLLIGSISRVVHWNQNGPLLYRSRVVPAVINQCVSVATTLLLCVWLLPTWGLLGVGLAFLYSQIQIAFVSAFVLRQVEGVPIGWRALAVSTATTAAAALLAVVAETHVAGQLALGAIGLVLGWRGGLHHWFWTRVRRRLPW